MRVTNARGAFYFHLYSGHYLELLALFLLVSAAVAVLGSSNRMCRVPSLIGEDCSWASEASPTWTIHLRFFIYYILLLLLSYIRRGLCDPPFFFLRRALCAVQSSCTMLFRCARPTHALHASSIGGAIVYVFELAL